ncbi:MAG: hypothetical protein R3F24_02650 [Gammaproteobacteria bacterium]
MTMNLVFVVPYAMTGGLAPHAGLAATTSIGSFINAALLYRGLRRTAVFTPQPGWGRFLLQVLLGVTLMSALLIFLKPPTSAWLAAGGWTRSGWLVLTVGGSGVVYFATLLAAGLRPADLRLRAVL